MVQNRRILLVEDDESLGYLLSEYLKMKQFAIRWVKNGVQALEALEKEEFDLLVLDVMMPEMDGFSLAREISDRYRELPFLFLTSRSLKIDVLKGFALGAVDYLKKPIDEEELVVRLNALLKNLAPRGDKAKDGVEELVQMGDYMFDVVLHELRHSDGSIQKLTQRESALLQLLWENKNELCTHKTILNKLWGKNDFFTKKSLNVFISHLRKYLAKDQDLKIDNMHNQGFVLRVNNQP